MIVSFTVHGTPAPQGSKTVAHQGSRSWLRDDNPNLKPWRQAVAAAALEAMNGQPALEGPVNLDAVFVFPRPRSHYGTGRNSARLKPSAPLTCSSRPDLDKLLRAIGDALTGIVIRDDAQIADLHACKHYGPPAAHIELQGR